MSSYDYPQGRETSHTHRPLADPANKLSYVVVSSSGVQKKLVNPVSGEDPIDLGLEKQEIIDSINERAAEHAHHHHHHHYHDEFGPESHAYHDGHTQPKPVPAACEPDANAAPVAPPAPVTSGAAACASEPTAHDGAGARTPQAAAPLSQPTAKPAAEGEDENLPDAANMAEHVPAPTSKPRKAKGQKKALKTALGAASVNMSAKKFAKAWDNRGESSGISQAGGFEASGCYVILTYPAKAKKATQYIGAYVGGSHNMGASVMRHLRGEGNPDVYADVKYGQDVRVLLYPYPEDLLRAKSHELVALLGPKRVYNA